MKKFEMTSEFITNALGVKLSKNLIQPYYKAKQEERQG